MNDELHPDLFGGETPIVNTGHSPYIDRKQRMGFKDESENKDETCKNCVHRLTYDYHNKRYFKCELIGVSNSEATDIRLKNTCNYFTTDEDERITDNPV